MSNPLVQSRATPIKTVELRKSAGILDDYAVRKNVATKEGTIEQVPTANNHIVNKAYSDSTLVEWASGNVTFVPIGGDIATYITNATAGDTLVLGSGTYTLTANLVISKAIRMMGWGRGKTIISSTAVDAIKLTASNIVLSDLSVVHANAGTTIATIRLGEATNDVITGLIVQRIDITQTGAATTAFGVRCLNSSGMIRDVDVVSSGATSNYGFANATYAEATTPATTYFVNCSCTTSGTATSVGGYSLDSSATQDALTYFIKCILVANATSGATVMRGVYATGDDAYAYIQNCKLDGATHDVIQASSATISVEDCQLVNNLTSGTIGYLHSSRTYGQSATAGNNGNAQTIATATLTTLTGWAGNQYDNQAEESSGVFTALDTGLYIVTGKCQWRVLTAGNTYSIGIYVNDVAKAVVEDIAVANIARGVQQVAHAVKVDVGLTIKVKVQHNKGSNVDVYDQTCSITKIQ
jgi:hypothetical protein